MAFKFGKIFDDMFGEGFKKISAKVQKGLDVDLDMSSINGASAAIQDVIKQMGILNKEADEVGKAIKDLETAMKNGTVPTEKMVEAQLDLNNLYEEANDIESKHKELRKKANEEGKKEHDTKQKQVKQNTSSWSKWSGKFTDSQKNFEAGMDSLFDQLNKGQITTGDLADEVAKLKLTRLKDEVKGLSELSNSDFSSKVIDQVGNIATTFAESFGPIGAIIGAAVGAALGQVTELNEALIDLQRATGGMATASRLGFDALGNSTKGMQSLATQAAAANISVQQFGSSLTDLFSGSLKAGQVAGLADDLSKSTEGLKNYAIEAARIEKLYGAKIGPAVSNLMSNFGLGIKDSTKLVREGADTARSLGLNVQAFTDNLTQATDLAGEFYFKTAEQMTKLAGLATQLGTSVNAIAGGVVKMNGITDLFNKQQQTAALGLSSFSKNLSKAYALQAQGKGAEAAQVQLQSLAKDLIRNGLTDKSGQVTQQGIATASAAGASQEQIQALQKMARNATKAGLALDQAFDPSKLTTAEKRRLEAAEQENQTIAETFGNMWGEIKGALLDPLAQILGPVIKGLANVLKPIVGIFTAFIGIIEDIGLVILTPFMEIFNQITKVLSDIFTPLQNLFNTLRTALAPVINMFKGLGIFIAKFIMVPFRIVGRVLGGIFDVISRVIKVIGEKLAPIFEWLSGLFSGGGEAIDGMLDTITDAFGWLADLVGGVIGTAFDVLAGIIGGVATALGWLWDGLVGLWDIIDEYLITPIADFLGPAFDALGEAIDYLLTPFKWLWEQLKTFGDWLAKWFGDDEEGGGTSELTPEDWKKVLGTEDLTTPKGPNVETPNANGVADAQQAVYAKGSETQKANEDAINKVFNGGGGQKQSGSTININVDPTFGNKQIVKEG